MTDSTMPAKLLAVFLLAGTALLGAGSAMHPVLTGAGVGSADLRVIAATPGWRLMHLSMLTGSALVMTGIWVRLGGASADARAALVGALAVICIGMTLNAFDILLMARSGTRMAAMFVAGRADVAPIFDAVHGFGLMAARFGNGLIALGALVLGIVEWRQPAQPRWLAWLAWIAAAGGLVGVLCFDESSRLVLGAVALLCGWEVATAVRVLIGRTDTAGAR
ncbi:MAG TPA: hypothetical protein VGR59_13855 [Gemmatimonadaceae bacterium]|nr:hypothetical protein [Gemmatimonadaceae bacterium]